MMTAEALSASGWEKAFLVVFGMIHTDLDSMVQTRLPGSLF